MNSHTKRALIHGPVASILAGLVVFALLFGALLSANSVQDPSGALAATGPVSEARAGTTTVLLQGGSIPVAGDEARNGLVAAPELDDFNIGVPSVSKNWLGERLRDTLRRPSGTQPRRDDTIGAPRPGKAPSNTRVLPALYLTYGLLQGADVYTTYVALKGGARELNPMLQWAAKNPEALIALKAASTVGTIYLLEKLRLRHRLAAVITTAAINIYYAAIVVHNGTFRPSPD